MNLLNEAKKKLEESENLRAEASDLAVEHIKTEAKKILKADSDLNEFIMAMGTCFFNAKSKGKYNPYSYSDEEIEKIYDTAILCGFDTLIINDERFQKEFFDMVEDLDMEFNVKGYPVRFKADGNEIHDW